MEEDRLKKIANLREILEDRVRTLEVELEGARALLEFVNSLLLEQSFKRVDTAGIQPLQPPTFASREVIPLKEKDGGLLATIYIGKDSMEIIPATDKHFNTNTPPFTSFLYDRVLLKMRQRDEEAVKMGRLLSDKAFSFDIEKDGDEIRRIIIHNVAPDRERELVSAIQWTLEKMNEKMRKVTS